MPKQQLIVSRFEGGLNTHADPRDIADNEFSALNSLSVSSFGLIKAAGKMASTAQPFMFDVLDFGLEFIYTAPGNGFYSYSSDFDIEDGGNTLGDSIKYSPTKMLIYMDGYQGHIYRKSDIYNTDDNGWIFASAYTGGRLNFWDIYLFFDEDDTSGDEFTLNTYQLYGKYKWDFRSPEGKLRAAQTNWDIYHFPPAVFGAMSTKAYGHEDADGNVNTNAFAYLPSDFRIHASSCEFAPFYKGGVTQTSSEALSTETTSPHANLVMHNVTIDGDNADLTGGSGNMENRNLTFFTEDGGSELYSKAPWGIGLQFSERLAGAEDSYTGQNGSGSWQPTTLVKYKFWATVIYEGNQESQPVAFKMFGSQTDGDDNGLEETDEIQFLSTFANTHSAGTVGNNMSVHFKPVVRLADDNQNYAFGSMMGPLCQTTNSINTSNSFTTGGERIIGSRIYWSESTDAHNNLWLMFDMDWQKGCRPFGAGEFTTSQSTWHAWDKVADSDPSRYHLEPDDFVDNRFYDPPRFETYQSINGYRHDSKLNAKWKTSVVANGRTYIGNIKRQEKTFFERYHKTDGDRGQFNNWHKLEADAAHGNGTVTSFRQRDPEFPDRMCKSPVGKHDIFPEENDIELFGANDDGDEIIKLEAFADRLLVFKVNSLYILNISRDTEVLEGSYKHFGLDGKEQCQSITTDVGVAWMNSSGVYYYDGQNIQSLTDNKIDNLWTGVSYSGTGFWKSSSGDIPSIGYDAKSKKIICAKNINDDLDDTISGTDDILTYDMKTKSWALHSQAMTTYRKKTNFVTFEDEMLYLEKSTMNPEISTAFSDISGYADRSYTSTDSPINKWKDAPSANSNINLLTKDIDFGAPAVRKKVYKVYISYKGNATGVTINYGTNGDNDTHTGQFYTTNADGSSTSSSATNIPLLNVGTDDWIRAELKPSASINNIYSFQLKIDGTSQDDFEINDMTIVYRMKSIK